MKDEQFICKSKCCKLDKGEVVVKEGIEDSFDDDDEQGTKDQEIKRI